MRGHDSVHCPNKLPADEDDRDSGGGAQEPHESLLQVFASGILVQLVHSWVDAHPTEEPLYGMAHAARAHAEDHHRVLRRQPLYALERVAHAHGGAPCGHVRPPSLCLVMHFSFKEDEKVIGTENEEASNE
jgi:hypothetical protein